MEFPVEFKKCPHCGAEGTIALQAMESELSKPINPLTYLEKTATPIQDFMKISTPTTKVLLRYHDTCSGCGIDRCVKAEKGVMPSEILMQMMGMAVKAPGKR